MAGRFLVVGLFQDVRDGGAKHEGQDIFTKTRVEEFLDDGD